MIDDPYIKMMFGENAVHVPLNIFIQSAGSDRNIKICSFVGVIPQNVLRDWNTAELWQADAVIRPQVKRFDTRGNFRGAGLSGALTTMADLDLWGESVDLRF